MIGKGKIIEVTIEKSAFGSEGIARFGEDKFVVFVKNSVPEDKLKVKITSLNKRFARAQIVEIVEPSKYRKKPFCPYYNACGSCSSQIFDYDFLVDTKTEILKDIFKNTELQGKIMPVLKSPQVLEYRHKVQFPVRQTKNSKRVLIGYFKENSHDITNIKFCPLMPEIINEIVQFIRDNYKAGCYDENRNKGLLKNILFRISKTTGEILMTFVLNSSEDDFENLYQKEIFKLFSKIKNNFPSIKGAFINLNPNKTNTILSDINYKILGDDYIIEKLDNKKYKIGSLSFFQVNPQGAQILFETVKSLIKDNSSILDAYGGVGAIGIYLSDKAKKITLVEENTNALDMALLNFKLNDVKNFEIFKGDAKNHFINFQKEKRHFDTTIIDPPCEKEGLEAIAQISKNIVYVSCNPLTLKRDMEVLLEYNFKPKLLQGVDLFPYTHHIESVVLFEKA